MELQINQTVYILLKDGNELLILKRIIEGIDISGMMPSIRISVKKNMYEDITYHPTEAERMEGIIGDGYTISDNRFWVFTDKVSASKFGLKLLNIAIEEFKEQPNYTEITPEQLEIIKKM